MPDQNQRKATDILISIEDKLGTLIQAMSSYNLSNNIILDRVNKVYNYIDKLEKEIGMQQQLPEDEIIKTSTDHLITVEENPIGSRRTSRVETYTPTQPTTPTSTHAPAPNLTQDTKYNPYVPANPIPTPAAPSQRSISPDRKVPVSQRITAVNEAGAGKDLFMAEVSIMNENKELVLKTKTNATGKWQAHLKPGKYFIHTVKTDTATKVKIEAMQELSIPDSDQVVVLPTALIKRNQNG